MPARILFVDVEDGFFLSHRRALAQRLREEGSDVIVATPPGDRGHEIHAAGFRHVPKAPPKSLNPLRMLWGVVALVRLYRTVRPDLIVHVSLRPILFGGLAALFCRTARIVNLVTGLGYVFTSGRPALRRALLFFLRRILRSPRHFTVFQNPDDRALFVRARVCGEEDSTVVRGSGVDTRRFRPRPEPPGTPRILFAARLLWDKGIGELAAAARILRRRRVPHRIVVAGSVDAHNPRAVPERQLRAWSEAGLWDWVGFDDDMPASLALAHIACLPSHREGVPRFLLEAAASGRPIVTTDAPGCREVVVPNENGLRVPAGDGDALADALQQLLESRRLRRRFGRAGRHRVLRLFSNDVVVASMARILRARLTGPRGGGDEVAVSERMELHLDGPVRR